MLNPPVMLNLFQQLLSHAEKPANQNKIFHQTLTSPLHPNKINFRSVSRRRKFGIIPPATQQISKSANQQISIPAIPQSRHLKPNSLHTQLWGFLSSSGIYASEILRIVETFSLNVRYFSPVHFITNYGKPY